jgi:hypothetical protein
VSSQASELRERKIGITPFDCPRDKATVRGLGSCTPKGRRSGPTDRQPATLAAGDPRHAAEVPCSTARSPSQRASSQAVPEPGTKQDAGGHDVPALWSCRVSVSELAIRAHRTRRLRLPTRRLAVGVRCSADRRVLWDRSPGSRLSHGHRPVGPGPRRRREPPHQAAHHPLATRRSPTAVPARARHGLFRAAPAVASYPWSTIGEASSDGEAEGGRGEDDVAVQRGF